MWTETNTTEELVQGVLRHGPDILNHCLTSDDLSKYLNRIDSERLNYPTPPNRNKFQALVYTQDYCPNLVEFLYAQCSTPEQTQRVNQELELFIKNGMYDLLHVMKYVVDTLRENNVVWGVGRGSSVASYVLHLIGVHKIDSIKYNIPIEEFFKGEQHG
jgi:DNA polymerase III alpha subunit